MLANYYFQVSFNLKVILYVAKITQNTVTELLLVCPLQNSSTAST